MSNRRSQLFFSMLALFVCCGSVGLAGDPEWRYFIQRSNLDGTSPQTWLDVPDFCSGLALDLDAGKLYFSDEGVSPNDPDGRIRRADLDGSNIEDVIAGPDHQGPHGIALDPAGGKLYWTDHGSDAIRRANLDGSGVETLIQQPNFFTAIALDLQNGKIYFGDLHRIRRANLDGTDIEVLVYDSNHLYFGIALDVANDRMYWTDPIDDAIKRSDLDGSNIETLVGGLDSPDSIALDLAQGLMYWTDFGSEEVKRANLDGSDIQILLDGASFFAIALDRGSGRMFVSAAEREDVVPAVSRRGAAILVALLLLGSAAALVRRARS